MHLRTPSEVKRFIELASTYNAPHCLCLRLVDDELSVHLSRDGRGYLWRETMIALLTIIGKTELPIKKLSFHMSSLDVGHIDIQSMSAVSVGRHCRSLVMGQHLKDVRIIDNLDDPLTGIERMKNLFNHLSVTVERLELLRFNLIGTRESYKDFASSVDGLSKKKNLISLELSGGNLQYSDFESTPREHWVHLRTDSVANLAVGIAFNKLKVKSLSPGAFRGSMIDAIYRYNPNADNKNTFPDELKSLDWTSGGKASENNPSFDSLKMLRIMSQNTYNLRMLTIGFSPEYGTNLFRPELDDFFKSDPKIECLTILCTRYHDRTGVKKILEGVASCSHLREFKFGTFTDLRRNFRYNDKETLESFYDLVEKKYHFRTLDVVELQVYPFFQPRSYNTPEEMYREVQEIEEWELNLGAKFEWLCGMNECGRNHLIESRADKNWWKKVFVSATLPVFYSLARMDPTSFINIWNENFYQTRNGVYVKRTEKTMRDDEEEYIYSDSE